MFETDLNLFFQSSATPWLTVLMIAVSSLGTAYGMMSLVCIALFIGNLRKGFVLGQMVIVAGLSAQLLKHVFALPRPYHVDGTVKNLAGSSPGTPFIDGDGVSLFDLPSQEAIDWTRSLSEVSYGLPSGHTAVAVALFGGLILLGRQRYWAALAALMIPTMAISRIYLGVHFPGDILGGLVVGGCVLWAAWWLQFRFLGRGGEPPLEADMSLHLYLMGISLFFAAFATLLDPKELGPVLGFNLGFWLINQRGLPSDQGSPTRRLARFLLAPLSFVAAKTLFNLIETRLGSGHLLVLIEGLCCTFILMVTPILLGERLGFYRR